MMKAYQMKIMVKNSHPPIWRRFIVPAGLSFSQLSIVLNEVMGWCGYHLSAFEFYHLGLRLEEEAEDDSWGDYDVDSASEAMIEPYMDSEEWFTYLYDFGDHWQHKVTIEKVVPDYKYDYPTVLKFKGETPYEDCGGIYGYYNLLEILKDPSHPEYEEMKEWTDDHFTEAYDMDHVNGKLKQLRLCGPKSKPMTQNEIYEEVLAGLPFKQIQGIDRIPTAYYDEGDEDDFWDKEDLFGNIEDEDKMELLEEIADLHGQIEEMLKFRKDMEMQSFRKAPEDMLLRDILLDYRKEDLVEIAKIHCLNGYSKYKKERLADFVISSILSETEMQRYFVYLEDEELEILNQGPGKAGGYVQEWPCDYMYLLEGGYCGGMFGSNCMIPGEVWEAYKKNCNAQWMEEREEKRELLDHLNAAAMLNGVCKLSDALAVYEKSTGIHKEPLEIWSFYAEIPESKRWFELDEKDQLILLGFEDPEIIRNVKKMHRGKELYIPSLLEVKTLSRKGYLPFDRHMKKLEKFVQETAEELPEDAAFFCREIQEIIRNGGSMSEVMECAEEFLDMQKRDVPHFVSCIHEVWNNTRMICNCGHTPKEMTPVSERAAGEKIIDFPVKKPKKIYPNDPCPCGSGKKYKNCCGRKK